MGEPGRVGLVGLTLGARGVQLPELRPLLLLSLRDPGVGQGALLIKRGAGLVLALPGLRALLAAQLAALAGDLLLDVSVDRVAIGHRLPGCSDIPFAGMLQDAEREVGAAALGLAEMLDPMFLVGVPHLSVRDLARFAELPIPAVEKDLALILVVLCELDLLARIEGSGGLLELDVRLLRLTRIDGEVVRRRGQLAKRFYGRE